MTRATHLVLRGVGLAALAGLAVLAIFAPRAAAAGWLVGFVTVGAVVLGSVALILVHALTGGRWGIEQRPAFVAAASATPALVIGFLLLCVAAPALYPWVRDPASAGPGVGSLYLNLPFFALRGLILLVGLSLVALLDRRLDGLSPLAAGLGLVWYVVGLDFVAIDWLQSLAPRYTSSAFGAQIIIEQFVAALAWAILATPATDDEGHWNDLGSLLLATTLGESYLILMTLVVHWYGDQPHQAAWYLARTEHGWLWLEVAGFLVGSAAPLVALLFAAVRRRAGPLKVVAVASLAGVLIENVWLVAPATGGWPALTGPFAAAGMAALLLGIVHVRGERGPHPQEIAADGV